MAQRDGSSNSGPRPYRSAYGSIAVRAFEESTASASSKTIQVGDLVCFDTLVATNGHRIVIAPSSQGNGGNLMQNGITSFVGVAISKSTNDAGDASGLQASTVAPDGRRMILVAIADGLTEFAIDISSVGATPQPPASSMIGQTYPIECVRSAVGQKGGHGVWFLSSTNVSTTADHVFCVTDVPDHQIGTTGGYVIGKFASTMVNRAIRVGGPVVA